MIAEHQITFQEWLNTEQARPDETEWHLYERLKAGLNDFDIDYETGIRMILEKLDI